MDTPRKAYFAPVRTLVVKLGTQVLSDAQGRLDENFLGGIAAQVAELRRGGMQVAIVSSGAVGAGLRELGLLQRPAHLAKLQAVAAVGQRRLMDAWADAFAAHKLPVAQLLLTREDVEDRTRFLNLRNTILAAQALGAIPIINENDTVSTDELVDISFGDNDILAALVAHALMAQLLVILTCVDGVLDEQDQPVRLLRTVAEADALVRRDKTAAGKGGMSSKVQAARMITEAGEAMVIADGRMENVLLRLLAGEELGTLFIPGGRKLSSRNKWIGSVRTAGSILVDAGCAKAIAANRSLLPAGVVKVEGHFQRGDVVGIFAPDGSSIGRGLSNFSAHDVMRIAGKKTAQVRELLGEAVDEEVVHRDNLLKQ